VFYPSLLSSFSIRSPYRFSSLLLLCSLLCSLPHSALLSAYCSAYRSYSQLPLIASSLLLITRAHHPYSSLVLITRTHHSYSSLVLITRTRHCSKYLLAFVTSCSITFLLSSPSCSHHLPAFVSCSHHLPAHHLPALVTPACSHHFSVLVTFLLSSPALITALITFLLSPPSFFLRLPDSLLQRITLSPLHHPALWFCCAPSPPCSLV
jgi:hypothetical protein